VSTPDRPKQLLPLSEGTESLLVETLDRARALAPAHRIRVLAGADLARTLRDAVPALTEEAFLVESRVRGTAPVLVWAAWHLGRLDPDAVLVSLHADHHIRPTERFVEVVAAAVEVASREDVLVTVGARPDRPETGYGYIQPGPALASGALPAFRVEAFHEKPDRETAARYVGEGFLWNTGIFVWRPEVLLREVREGSAELADVLPLLDAGDVEAFFDAAPVCTVDVAVLEKSSNVAVVPATFDWDDVGSWPSLCRTRQADAEGNVTVGEAHILDGTDNVTYAEDGAIVLWGVSDLVVVKTGGVTLVLPRERAPRLKELLERLPESLREGSP
jgi:mannose-1-phosphate guanylyltransferase